MSHQTASLSEKRDMRSMVALAWRRRWVVLIPTLAGLLAGVVIGHPKVLRPVYRASATLLLDFPQPIGQQLQGMVATGNPREQLMRIRTLMQSNDFLLKVAQSIHLHDDPALRKRVQRYQSRYPGLSFDELLDLQITKLLRGGIRLGQGRGGENVIVITVEDYYPERAHGIVQALADGVIEANRSTQLERVRMLHDFSLEQLVIYKERLSEAERELANFESGMAVESVTAKAINPASAVEIQRLRSEAIEERSRLRDEQESDSSALEAKWPDASAVLSSLQQQDSKWTEAVDGVCELERKYAEGTTSPPGSPGSAKETYALLIARQMGELRQQALTLVSEGTSGVPESLRREAADLMITQARLEATEARIKTFDSLLAGLRRGLAGTPSQETTLRRLTDEVETNRALYNAFVQQLASSQISEAFEATMASGRLTVLEPPSRPLSPVKPNRVAVGVLSTLIGLMMGVGALLLVERHDQTYRDAREAERALGLRVLGTLPQIDGSRREARKGAGIWTAARLERYLHDSPAYLEMRRVILQMRSEEGTPVRSLLVTSTRGGEGKTTSTILLGAAAASEEPRTPVLLVDLDLRRGGLCRMVGITGETPGVVQAMESHRIDDTFFQKTPIANLKIMGLGSDPAPRNDLLTFEGLTWFLPELTRRYGFVIIDSPPNLPVPDPLIIGQLVDAVMIVIKAGSTPRNMVERAVELQKQFTGNVRGLLMNNVAEMMPYYYNYRYYRYPSSAHRAKRQDRSG